jgi:glycosidase
MNPWPKHPVIYEINTWIWLQELSQTYKKHLTLNKVPGEVWDSIGNLGVDTVWLMGVWERSPMGIEIANKNKGMLEDFRRALSDYELKDNVGSPYCIRQYVVDKHLGGSEGLAVARKELSRRGIKLILDFVPNHVAPDHPWVIQHSEFFIQGTRYDAKNDPASFIETEGKIFTCGRDPFFPAWPDVLQLNAFNTELRNAVIETLWDIGDQCDGVRCDMAMLLINSIFERTWNWRAGERPATEYWMDVISAVKKIHSDFLFMAEAYWDLEWELQQQGFDYCYDKVLYDHLEHDNAESIRLHLCADIAYQEKLVRFIENHDEPRASAIFPSQKKRTAAIVMATIPGAKLFHEGQFEGRKIKLPVFLGRRPVEMVDLELQLFYHTLLKTISRDVFRNGHWQLVDVTGWPDNQSYQNILAWCWHGDAEYHLIIVNLSDSDAQALVRLPWDEFKGKTWQITDLFTETEYERDGDEMVNNGLYVDLPPWGWHFMTRIKEV